MLSKAKIKWINSLTLKKNRDEESVFVAEGVKLVSELLVSFPPLFLAYTDENLLPIRQRRNSIEKVLVSESELLKISTQKSPQGIVAVFPKPKYEVNYEQIKNSLTIALDEIQDPGNLGTIIRLADWFGIKDVFCSTNTADIYGSKAVQATMGAVSRMRVHYVELSDFLQKTMSTPIYGTFMIGDNIYDEELTSNGIIVMGNEGKGISKEIVPFISKKLYIPSFPSYEQTSESLNVSAAMAITVSEFRRRSLPLQSR